ncbi:hypothetical protein AGMMS50284_7390 [Clostridia bacterium]|nr:hypothetical protein AGMMS50284_7390 [Clostridia bacterium]
MQYIIGLRRSEIWGLKWEDINFKDNTIIINRTYCTTYENGKTVYFFSDTTKTESGYRTYPILPVLVDRLKELKAKQQENEKWFKNSYCQDYKGYVCVNEQGKILNPTTVTLHFKKLAKINGLKIIRFHGIRHSNATLQVRNGIDLREIQKWLGHSSYSSTLRYAHADPSNKRISAEFMNAKFTI